MSSELAGLIGVMGALMLAGFAAGCARVRWRVAPLLASAIVLAPYLVAVAVTGIWTASCPECSFGEEDNRIFVLKVVALFYGALGLSILVSIWTGAAVAWLLGKLFESRGGLRGSG